MRTSVALLTSVLTAGCLISACSSMDNGVTSPTSVGAGSSLDSSSPSDSQPTPPQLDLPPVPPSELASSPVLDTCDATKAKWATGERASDNLLERARVAAKAGSARFLRPNQPITLEYLVERLNLGLDTAGVVRSVTCG
jgi:hypothetical protein